MTRLNWYWPERRKRFAWLPTALWDRRTRCGYTWLWFVFETKGADGLWRAHADDQRC